MRVRRTHRIGLALIACTSAITMVSNPGSAVFGYLDVSPVAEANTLTAACVASLSVTPVSYTPGSPSHGSFTATVNAPCVGSGFRYNYIYLPIDRDNLTCTPVGGCTYNTITSVSCTGTPSCSLTYSFSGQPSPSLFEINAYVKWTSTAGDWEWAMPPSSIDLTNLYVSSECYTPNTHDPVRPVVYTAYPDVQCDVAESFVL